LGTVTAIYCSYKIFYSDILIPPPPPIQVGLKIASMQKSFAISPAKRGLNSFLSHISTLVLCIVCMWGGFILGMSTNTSKHCEHHEEISGLNISPQNDGKRQLNTPSKGPPTLFIKSKRDHPSHEDESNSVEQADIERKLTRNEAVRGKSPEVHKDKVSNRLTQEQPSRLIHSLCHKQLSTRGELPSYLTSLGLLGEGVEIGVRDGDFSQWVLSRWSGEKLHMVDPWAHQGVKLYNDKSNV